MGEKTILRLIWKRNISYGLASFSVFHVRKTLSKMEKHAFFQILFFLTKQFSLIYRMTRVHVGLVLNIQMIAFVQLPNSHGNPYMTFLFIFYRNFKIYATYIDIRKIIGLDFGLGISKNFFTYFFYLNIFQNANFELNGQII